MVPPRLPTGSKSFDLQLCKEYVEKEEELSNKMRSIADLREGASALFERLKSMSLEQLSAFLQSCQLKDFGKGKFILAKKWVMEQEESQRSHFIGKLFKLIDFQAIFEKDQDFLHQAFSDGGFLSLNIEFLQIYNNLLRRHIVNSQCPPLTPPSTSRSDETGNSESDEEFVLPSRSSWGRQRVSTAILNPSPRKTSAPSPVVYEDEGANDSDGDSVVTPKKNLRVRKTQMAPCKKMGSPGTNAIRQSSSAPARNVSLPRKAPSKNLAVRAARASAPATSPKSPARVSRSPPVSKSQANVSTSPRRVSKSPAKRPRSLVPSSSPPNKRSTRRSGSRTVESLPSETNCFIYQVQKPKGRFLYSYNWQTKRQEQLYKIETPRKYSSSIAVGDRFYDLGGTEMRFRPDFGDSSEGSKIVEVFGIGAERYRSRGPPMLEKRKEFSVCVVDEFLYAIGGCCKDEASNSCERLNTRSSDSWEQMKHYLNVPRGAHTTQVIGTQIFAIGGIGAEHERTVEIYDTQKPRKWDYVARMISPRGRHGTVVLNNIIYALGGEDAEEVPLKTAECYNPVRDRWTQMPPMHHARRDLGGVYVADGCVLAMGGTEEPNMPFMEAYDPREGRWRIIQEENGLGPMGR